MTFHYQIVQAEQDLEARKAEYLRRFGWTQTCSTPGAYWLWERDFKAEDRRRRRRWRERKPSALFGKPSAPVPYGRVTAPTDLAVRMTTAFLDRQLEVAEDD